MRDIDRGARLQRVGFRAAILKRLCCCCLSAASMVSASVHASAFMSAVAPDPDDKPLQIGIWYPNGIGEFNSSGGKLPLVLLSHGIAGTYMDLKQIAAALADAGFIAVGVTHTGDNFNDKSYVSQGRHLHGRSRHIARAIDYMLSGWPQHEAIDPARIGVYGFSAGGFAALVTVGGEPELSNVVPFCKDHPSDWDCGIVRDKEVLKLWIENSATNVWVHDRRVRAAVVVAPAAGYVFVPHGLSKVSVPIQLWAGTEDHVVDTQTKTAVVHRLIAAPVEYHEVKGATHFAFTGPCAAPLQAIMAQRFGESNDNPCVDSSGFDRAAFYEDFVRQIVKFFQSRLPPPRANAS
jgi:predicted dienelactone hydrolase